jgi:ABC-type multidrug transport system ATPase subunit
LAHIAPNTLVICSTKSIPDPLSSIIEAAHLSKSFKHVQAVRDLSFSIQPGDIYGFLGQNGAGKSTTMRMLLGLIHPDAGHVKIKGEDFNNSRPHLLKHVGAIIERPDMYGYLSGWDNLRIFARLSDMKIPESRLHELLQLVNLKGREQDKVKTYSQGMKQRLGIAIALVHNPDLLILDEPTNGLDPQGIAEMRHLIIRLSKEHGKTILISSHLLYEIEQMATRMIIIHRGQKVAEGLVSDLLHPSETLMEVMIEEDPRIRQLLQDSAWRTKLQTAENGHFTFKMHPNEVPELNNWLVANQARVLQLEARHSLEAYFLSLTDDAAIKH